MNNGYWPIYLHFFDKHWLRSLEVYDLLPLEYVLDDLRVTLLWSVEPLYVSAAMIFENKYANAIYKSYPNIFSENTVNLLITENSIVDYIKKKQAQYQHTDEESSIYLNDRWFERIGQYPKTTRREFDTTKYLELELTKDILTGGLSRHSKNNIGLQNINTDTKSALASTIQERGDAAITISLFEQSVEHKHSPLFPKRELELLIAENYLCSYLEEYKGTICTSLCWGGHYFDYLCPSFPLHDLRIARAIWNRTGLVNILKKWTFSEIISLRQDPNFEVFIDTARKLIADEYHTNAHLGLNATISSISAKLSPRKGKISDSTVPQVLCDVINQSLERRTIFSSTSYKGRNIVPDKKQIFVVHGRNMNLRKDFFSFLRSVGLKPLEWEHAIDLTGCPNPYLGDVIDAGMKSSHAIVVILTADDWAYLRDDLLEKDEKNEPALQPRPNVIFEAGLALGKYEERTLLIEIGKLRGFSDLAGRHIVRLDNSMASRNTVLSRLKNIGCTVDTIGADWTTTGNFDSYD